MFQLATIYLNLLVRSTHCSKLPLRYTAVKAPKVNKLDLNLVTNAGKQPDMQHCGALCKHSYRLKELLHIMSVCL